MKISTRSRYGIRLMLELAEAYGQEAIALGDIAKRQDISARYLSKLIQPLKTAGFVIAARGYNGGYTLAHPPDKITLFDIVKTLEGDISPVPCLHDAKYCYRTPLCDTRNVWQELDNLILDFLQKKKLSTILKQKQTKQEIKLNYSI